MATHDDATVAALFRAALSLGIATPADLVPWADEQVMARERPAAWILDLSLGAGVPAERVIESLGDVARRADLRRVFRLLVGLVEGGGDWDWLHASTASSWLLVAARMGADDGDVRDIDGIDDGIYLCDEGVCGDRASLIADVVAFVRRHADPAARAWLPGVRVTFAGGTGAS